jgi:hypothetical protein
MRPPSSSAPPICVTAASTTSRSPFSSTDACFSARPFCATAASTTSRSRCSPDDAKYSAAPCCTTAASTTSRSPVSAVDACSNARPFCAIAASTNSRSPFNSAEVSSSRSATPRRGHSLCQCPCTPQQLQQTLPNWLDPDIGSHFGSLLSRGANQAQQETVKMAGP